MAAEGEAAAGGGSQERTLRCLVVGCDCDDGRFAPGGRCRSCRHLRTAHDRLTAALLAARRDAHPAPFCRCRSEKERTRHIRLRRGKERGVRGKQNKHTRKQHTHNIEWEEAKRSKVKVKPLSFGMNFYISNHGKEREGGKRAREIH